MSFPKPGDSVPNPISSSIETGRRRGLFQSVGRMRRHLQPELLDAEGVSDEDLSRAYRELRVLHYWLGNTAAVLRTLRKPLAAGRVLDIGCGHGALLEEIQRKMGLDVLGIDLRPAPITATVPIVTGNAVSDPLPRANVAVSVVMAHHLSEAEVVSLIRNVAQSCDRFILLDLVRHPVPLGLFKLFVTPFLCRINAQDGQTSIRRAFTALELGKIVEHALAGVDRPVRRLLHTVSPLWIRQVVDISWAPVD